MFDELASDESQKFKVETYYAVFDVILNEIRELERFESFAETVVPFCCLPHPKIVDSHSPIREQL